LSLSKPEITKRKESINEFKRVGGGRGLKDPLPHEIFEEIFVFFDVKMTFSAKILTLPLPLKIFLNPYPPL
jgi:hypothetical protein